jgi:N-acetylglutamate synthase-like GNAT family acetyltransferase
MDVDASRTVAVAGSRPADLGEIEGLLALTGLSADGVPESLNGFVLVREHGRLVATACLEEHGSEGLLRSVATLPDRRGRGLAGMLVGVLLERARAKGYRAVYLLTNGAEAYFERFGFRRIERQAVPSGVREAGQFRSQTCAASVVMVFELSSRTVEKEA